MIPRILEAEVMDAADDASDYDAMDHSAVNVKFAADFLSVYAGTGPALDVGTGTAQIPIEICRQNADIRIVAVDLADDMLKIAERNVQRAGFSNRISLEKVNARGTHFQDGQFPAVISNSIIHHIPEPLGALAEMVRVCAKDGVIFVRDLFRPDSLDELNRLVELYAGNENAHSKQLFWDSLHAALTLDEIRELVVKLGFDGETVQQTSDRHWTWNAKKASREH